MISTSRTTRRSPPSPLLLLMLMTTWLGATVRVGTAFFVVAPSPLRQPTAGGGLAAGATERRAAAAARGRGKGGSSSSSSSSSSSNSSSRNSSSSADGDDDIDLDTAMANARANLAEGTSPGAGLESAFDQADAAFADLIVTSVDDQGVTLDEQDVEELAKGGMMDDDSKTKKSKGLFGDMSDVFGALSGGAHIVRREDGTL